MLSMISSLGPLVRVDSQEIALPEPFLEFAGRFAAEPGTVILMSGGMHDCARYHILAARPWLTHTARHADNWLRSETGSEHIKANPLDVTRLIIDSFSVEQSSDVSPVRAGLFGYLAYDLKEWVEHLPATAVDDLHLPHLCLFAPSLVLVHDRFSAKTRLYISVLERGGYSVENNLEYVRRVSNRAGSGRHSTKSMGSRGLGADLSKTAYLQAVSQIQEYIEAGDVYQVNLSQRFNGGFPGNGFELFSELFSANPAPFFAYINAGDHEIISTSPERFLLRQGDYVETRPIKGTRPRGRTSEEDAALKAELVSSAKDGAELAMIVDLLRNDLGKACVPGSIQVAEHKKLEVYANVTHMVSRVVGRLDEGRDAVDLIQAAFPGGSITGCPKIRSMEIIDELEPSARHVYTGSVGYLSFHQTMDLSIAIRTATLVNSTLRFSVGGGVVYDSSPESEYEETLHKGQSFFEVVKRRMGTGEPVGRVWHNGRLVPEHEAKVPVRDLGFQYGYGVFETLRSDQGDARQLDKHIQRLRQGWQALTSIPFPELDWPVIVGAVVEANGLSEACAAVKIMLTRGSNDKPPYDRNIAVTAKAYTPPRSAELNQGVRLITYPHPRATPLASHKTLNHLFYHLAGVWAREHNADQALILNPDHTVSETHAAGLLALNPGEVFVPKSPHVLPSIMTEFVLSRLQAWGWVAKQGSLALDDLHGFEHLLVANSLLGAVSVVELDRQPVAPCHELAGKLTQETGPGKDDTAARSSCS